MVKALAQPGLLVRSRSLINGTESALQHSRNKDGSLCSGHQPTGYTRDQAYGWRMLGPPRPRSVSTRVQVVAHLIFAAGMVDRYNQPIQTI